MASGIGLLTQWVASLGLQLLTPHLCPVSPKGVGPGPRPEGDPVEPKTFFFLSPGWGRSSPCLEVPILGTAALEAM